MHELMSNENECWKKIGLAIMCDVASQLSQKSQLFHTQNSSKTNFVFHKNTTMRHTANTDLIFLYFFGLSTTVQEMQSPFSE